MAKVIKQQVNHNLAQSYDLIIADLFSKLTKMKEGVIKLGELGTFQKKLSRVTNSFGVYRYYRINFSASSLLKKELDK